MTKNWLRSSELWAISFGLIWFALFTVTLFAGCKPINKNKYKDSYWKIKIGSEQEYYCSGEPKISYGGRHNVVEAPGLLIAPLPTDLQITIVEIARDEFLAKNGEVPPEIVPVEENQSQSKIIPISRSSEVVDADKKECPICGRKWGGE